MSSTVKVFQNGINKYEDTDANGMKNENNNAISDTGQSLDTGDNNQTSKAMAIYAAKGDFYKESAGSSANVYILENTGTQQQVFELQDGMQFRFQVVNANTGASTANINSLGAKSIRYIGGSLSSGRLKAGTIVQMRYSISTDLFELQFSSSFTQAGNIAIFDLTDPSSTDIRCLNSDAAGLARVIADASGGGQNCIMTADPVNLRGEVGPTNGTYPRLQFSANYIGFNTDSTKDFGDSTHKPTDIYASNTVIQTSDIKFKKDVESSELGLDFTNRLRPVRYRLKDIEVPEQFEINKDGKNVKVADSYTKTHERYHYGLIADEVKVVLDDLSINTKDFAPYIENESGKGLRYTEFIPILMKSIQELSQRVKELEGG